MDKVLIIGFGKTGQAFFKHLKGQAELWVYDDKPLDYPMLNTFQAGIHYDYALVSPGVAPAHKIWTYCRAENIPVYGEIEYAFQRLHGRVIGITGTNGKTTTTTLVYEMYHAEDERTYLAGNIGKPLLDYVATSTDDHVYITELSSFQLETTDRFKPYLAAITNITPDHLSWHEDMEHYIDAKFKIFRNMSDLSKVVINQDDPQLVFAIKKAGYEADRFFPFSHERILSRGCYVKAHQIVFHDQYEEPIIALDEILLPGIHNLENILCAVALAKLGGVNTHTIATVLRSFKGVAHRYEVISEKWGRRFINDSKATNPESTIPALRSVKKPTILIAGGMDKRSDFRGMFAEMSDLVEKVLIFGENKHKMIAQMPKEKQERAELVQDLDEAFQRAMQCSGPGYDILLSPASASWDMYPSFEVRGDHFKRLVGELDV